MCPRKFSEVTGNEKKMKYTVHDYMIIITLKVCRPYYKNDNPWSWLK